MQDFISPLVNERASKLENWPRDLLETIVADLDGRWGSGEMTAAAYDTAWVAMVRKPDQPDQLAFPASFEWLLQNQSADGSWGGPAGYSVLPTLAALLALLKTPNPTEQTRRAAYRAEFFLEKVLTYWSVNNHESVGFEVLAPGLLGDLEKLGVVFDFPDKADLLKLYTKKMLIAGPELIYSNQSNLIHSLEAFGPTLDYHRLKTQQAANGSYGCSPAATAAVLIYGREWDEKAAAWLSYLSKRAFDTSPGAMPNAYPIDAFESSWALYNLTEAGVVQEDLPDWVLQALKDWLGASLSEQGGSISRFGGLPTDSDDTGMIIAALNLVGAGVPVDSLLRFERETYFSCFERERDSSLSANTHVLAALLGLPLKERLRLRDSLDKVVEFLYSERDIRGFWEDKWHLSPYYASACAVLALQAHDSRAVRERLRPTLDWVLETQSSRDGGWGVGDFSTLEETAYALQILQAAPDLIRPWDKSRCERAIQRGKEFLWKNIEEYYPDGGARLPKLWRGKELYTPVRVVFSAVLAALYTCRK